jgi:hypothetical protein
VSTRAFVSIALLAALAVRVACLRGELWLDEIWSLDNALHLASPAGILTELHHDNNHPLTTLAFWLLGAGQPAWVHRLPALAAGLATVLLARAFAHRWGGPAECFAVLLCGSSYLLVVYSSEARGYAFAGCFALGAFLTLERHVETGARAPLAAFWACAVLGPLSHLVFLQAYCGIAAWSVARLARGRASRRLALVHGPPLAALLVLWAVHLRHLEVGGGPEHSVSEVLRAAAAVTVGVTGGGAAAWAAAALAAGIWGGALAVLATRERALALLFLVVTAAAPLLALALRPDVLFVRYFYVAILFHTLLLVRLLAWFAARGPRQRLLAWLAAAAFAGAHARAAALLVRHGRGDVLASLRETVGASPEPVVHVGGDHDFRCRIVLEHLASRIRSTGRIVYHAAGSWPAAGPEWLLLCEPERFPPRAAVTSAQRFVYDLAAQAPAAPLAGLPWLVYRRR